MPKQKNIDSVGTIKDKLSKAKSMVLTDYRGLTHKQLEDLHRTVKKVQGEFLVSKNSLLRIAATDTGFKLDNKDLLGPTAALLAYDDEISPLKELFKFIKTNNLPTVKFGFLGGVRYDGDQISQVAKLPGQDALRGQVVSALSSPIYGLAYTLNANLQKFVYVLSKIKN